VSAELAHPIITDMHESQGSHRDLTNTQMNELRLFFNDSLFHFAWTFFGFKDLIAKGPRPVHWEICQILKQLGMPATEPWHPGRRMMIQVPRGSYKTSLCTTANSLWRICRDPDETVLICNEIMENSKKWLRAIREIAMANKLFQTVYADLLPPGIHWKDKDKGRNLPRWWKWNDQEVLFERSIQGIPEASLTAAGVGTATTGGHWTFIAKDDLVSEDAKNSEAVMQRVKEWYDSSLPLEKPPYKGVELIVCTPWTYNDVYRYILEKYDVKLYRRSVIEQDPDTGEDRSLLPHKWSLKELYEERERDPYKFSSQMMCIPRAGREQSFDPDWIRYFEIDDSAEPEIHIPDDQFTTKASKLLKEGQFGYDPEVAATQLEPAQHFKYHQCTRTLIVDPASAEKDHRSHHGVSNTGIVAVAMDPWGRIFVMDGWRGRGTPYEIINHIFRLAQKWKITKGAIEEVVFSTVYRYWLRDEARRRGIPLTMGTVRPKGRNKDDRIRQLIPTFQRGFCYFNSNSRSLEALKREYLDFPYAANRDMMDALAYTAEVLRKPMDPSLMDPRLPDDDGPTKTDVCGYGSPYF
jgi:GNAT superfamily N-acetyltransferase